MNLRLSKKNTGLIRIFSHLCICIIDRRDIFIFFPEFFLFSSILRVTAIRNRESISMKGLTSGIKVSIAIWSSVVSQIGLLSEGTEREGFEPSVNKSLHSSSNATPWTTRPPLLHNDYEPKTEWIGSYSYSIIDYWDRYIHFNYTNKNRKFFIKVKKAISFEAPR